MKGKFLAVMIAFLVMGVGAFVAYVMGKYGGFTTIPLWDVLMWIFICVLGILVLLILAVILLIASFLNGDEEEPEPKRKRKSSAAQKKKPEKKLRMKRERKPRSRKKENGAEKLDQIEHPAEWDEEEFE